ncbi:MAG: tyrosine-type recombinase/integrase [Candidatus Nanohaloarchaea archaeon]
MKPNPKMSYQLKSVPEKLEEFQNLDYISSSNKELITDFVNYLQADPEVNDPRIYKYIGEFKVIFREYIDFNLKEANKKQMRKAVGKIRSSDKSPHTQRDYLVAIKKLYRTIWEEETERPKRVKKILNANFMKSPSLKGNGTYNALEPDEVMAMVEVASNPRDKLLPLFFFETGARVGEIIGLRGAEGIRLKDVNIEQQYADVKLEALKKGSNANGELPTRNLPLTRCVDLLQKWLEQHPEPDNPEAHLFVNISWGRGTEPGDPMTERNVLKKLKALAKEAGIDKRVTCHAMRHASATHKGMNWTAQRLKWWHAWSKLETAQNYIQENEDRLREKHLEDEGVEEKEKSEGGYRKKTCGRCGSEWPPTQKYCGDCSLALDKDSANEVKELEEARDTVVQEELEGMDRSEIVQQMQELKQRMDKLEN